MTLIIIIVLSLFAAWVLRTLETGLALNFVLTLILAFLVYHQTGDVVLTLISWLIMGLFIMTDRSLLRVIS